MDWEVVMNDKLNQTMRIRRSPKVKTDDRGRTVWVDSVETAELELVSTQMLKHIIESGDVGTQNNLREVAEGKDGLLARDTDKGRFEAISDEELQHILDGTDMKPEEKAAAGLVEESVAETVIGEEELELVSTQMLRLILSPEDEDQSAAEASADSGFDPYDHG